MSKRYVRRVLALTAGMRKAIIATAAGAVLFAFGAALSFHQVIEPGLRWLANYAREIFASLPLHLNEDDLDFATHLLGGAFLLLGGYALFAGIRRAVRHVAETANPSLRGGMFDVYRERQKLAQGPRIVALGGGTGLSTLLRGLKLHSSNITAIVTVTDDGGSSGRLTQERGMIPPGDIRNCLVALADAEKAMTDLFQFRFKDGGSLSGHSLGNLLITALVDQARGDFEKAVESASAVLAIRGRVIPATLDHVSLRALLENGVEICGETSIASAGQRIRKIYLEPANVVPHPAALEAIRTADLICIGPGSVYTSIIPNLLVPGLAQALKETQAIKVYICNVMTQPGESDSFSASEHVNAILTNTESRIFDYVLVNKGVPSESSVEKYRESGQFLVDADPDRIRAMGFRPILGDFTSESDFVRHDPSKVAERLMGLLK